MLDVVEHLERRWAKQLRTVEFAVEDVPPSDPAPWESGSVMARAFAADQLAGLNARVVLYRRVVEGRCDNPSDLEDLVHAVVVEQVARLLDEDPATIDPGYRPE